MNINRDDVPRPPARDPAGGRRHPARDPAQSLQGQSEGARTQPAGPPADDPDGDGVRVQPADRADPPAKYLEEQRPPADAPPDP